MTTVSSDREAVRAQELAATRLAPQPSDTDADNLAKVVVSTPSLRAAFFSNPTKAVGALLPAPRFWKYRTAIGGVDYLNPLNLSKRYRYRAERALLAKAVFDRVCEQVGSKEMRASVNTESVFAEFFAPIAKVTQRSYSSIYALSWAAFIAGVALIVLGGVIGLTDPKGVDATILAGVFGGAGALSALGSVYGMSVNGIREATYDLARTRVTLTGFAAQLGILRGVFEGELKKPLDGIISDVTPVTDAIAKALTGALLGVHMTADQAADDGQSGPPPEPPTNTQPTKTQPTKTQSPTKAQPSPAAPIVDITDSEAAKAPATSA